MKNHLYLFLSFLIGFIPEKGKAQITVSYPLENCVFQRDLNNRSTIYIAGSFSEFLDVIEARLTPVQPGWGEESAWLNVVSSPKNGYFSGNIEWTGGWYRLEVRGRVGDHVVGSAQVSKVGIGEVFLISGQSNGQGYLGNGAPSAGDERVIHADYDGFFGPNAPLPYPSFSHLDADDVISPRGKSAWLWGKLGDNLSSRLNVPVLFYNVAWDGSAVQAWKASINGIAWSAYDSSIPFEPAGMPYGNLRNVMQNYVAITGIRAILWLQGEADNDVGTSQENYYSTLETVINQTRSEFNKNLSWVVARTSYTARAGSSPRILNAQNQIIQNISNVFAGPEMDLIQIPRPDGYHLYGEGLVQAAEAWSNSLTNEFFSTSVPYKSKEPIQLFTTCSDNTLTIHTEGAYHNHRWNNGSTDGAITPGEGTYQVSAYDPEGNYRFSPKINIPGNIGSSTPPSVSSAGAAEVCYGGSLTLVSSSDRNPVWNTGQTGSQIQVSAPGDYSVTIENVYGCRTSSSSFSVALSNKPLPSPPVISSDRSTEICDGEEVKLTSSTGTNTFWSTGAENVATTGIKHSGEYTARTRDSEGCFSNNSNNISIHVNALPAKPVITTGSSPTFCEGGEVTLKSSYGQGNTWSNNSAAESIVVKQSGEYRVSVTDSKGCKNTSDATKVTVNPLPAAPVVTALRPVSFCQGDYSVLSSSSQHSYSWSTGASTREINVNQNGDYWLTATDQNGCTSKNSNVLTIQVNPLPLQPEITVTGNTTFCENSRVILEAPGASGYLWSNGTTSKSLAVNIAGIFYVQTLNEFGCHSPRSAAVTTRTLPIPPAPVVTAGGPTEICDNSDVGLTAAGSPPFLWSTEATASSIRVTESGTYYAMSVGQNGCNSNQSNPVGVVVRLTPVQPLIEPNGLYAVRVSNETGEALYNWLLDNQPLAGSSAGNIRVNKTGEYSVQAFIKYNDNLTCFSDYSDPLRFMFSASSPSAGVFPNPSNGRKVMVETAEMLTRAVVSVYSLQGARIASFTFDTISVPVEIELPPGISGIYIVRIEADNFTATKTLAVTN